MRFKKKLLDYILRTNTIHEDDLRVKRDERKRLAELPRFSKTSTVFFGSNIIIPDACTFLSSYDEIFSEEIYKFHCLNKMPIIIDCGANIGMAGVF